VTLFFLLLLGVANTAFSATANTSLQFSTPDHLRGRVMALYMLLFAGSTPIGGYLTGVMAEHLGVQTAASASKRGLCMPASVPGCCTTSHRQQIRRRRYARRRLTDSASRSSQRAARRGR
jgi:MFS family permease